MEALSILGTTSSIISILDVASRCIKSLRAFKQHWDDADMTINLLVGQISTLKAALEQISNWMSTSVNAAPQHHQLLIHLEQSLYSCRILISFTNDHTSSLETDRYNELHLKGKAQAILQDRRIRDCVSHLNNQTGALNLLLTASNWFNLRFSVHDVNSLTSVSRSITGQTAIFLNEDNRRLIDRMKDDSSSLVITGRWHRTRGLLLASTE